VVRITGPRRAAGLALAAVLAATALVAGSALPAAAVDRCPDPRTVTPGNPIIVCSTSSYVDAEGITHLLGELYNPGGLVEAPAAVLTVQTSAGTRRDRVYPPFGWLDTGKRVAFDDRVARGISVQSFGVIELQGLTPVARPNNGFTFSNLVFATGPSDDQAVRGTVTNASATATEGIKIAFTAYDAGGHIAWYQPYIVTGNNRRVQPGQVSDFSIPRNDVPASAIIGQGTLVAEGNEPASLIPGAPPQRALGTPPTTVPRRGPSLGPVASHAPVDQPNPAGVPAPGSSAVAGVAKPGTEPLRHDAKFVRRAAGPLPSLVAEPVAVNKPVTTSAYAPVLLVGGLGLVALILLGRQLAAFRGALAERRQARKARAAPRAGDLAEPDYVPPRAGAATP